MVHSLTHRLRITSSTIPPLDSPALGRSRRAPPFRLLPAVLRIDRATLVHRDLVALGDHSPLAISLLHISAHVLQPRCALRLCTCHTPPHPQGELFQTLHTQYKFTNSSNQHSPSGTTSHHRVSTQLPLPSWRRNRPTAPKPAIGSHEQGLKS